MKQHYTVMPGSLDGVEAFVRVAERRSFRRAADDLGISPSAVSQAIRALEARVGVALFTRTTRAVGLTKAGASYLAHLEPILLALDEADNAVRGRGELRGVLEQAVDELPEAFRLVFVLRTIEEMSTEETALHLAIKPETVKTRLHRARQLVRNQLNKQIGPVLMDAFPFAGRRCERLTEAVLRRLGIGM